MNIMPKAHLQKVNKPKTRHGKNSLYSEGGDTMASKMNAGFAAFIAKKKEGAKTGAKKGAMPMMAKKKDTFEKSGKDVEKKGMKEGSKADMALDKNQMGMKRGGPTSKMPAAAKMGSMNMAKGGCALAKGGGIESKGKTKGKMITMKRGGGC